MMFRRGARAAAAALLVIGLSVAAISPRSALGTELRYFAADAVMASVFLAFLAAVRP